jgi:parvulin-like peptidyl-prolyl isomerase
MIQRKLGLALSLAMIPGVSAHAATELAKINGATISLEEFNQRYQDNLKFFQFKAPSRKAVLEDLIKRELAIQEARKLGLDKDPVVIERMNTVLYQALLEKKLAKEFEQIKISDDEAKAYYSKNPEIRTSTIFIALAPNASAEEVKKGTERMRQIQNEQLKPGKMTFAEVAQRFSEGPAASMGGDIDFQTRDKLDPAYYDAALALRTPGKVSDIVRTPFGLHLIKLAAVRSWDETDRGQVKRMIFEERRAQIFEKFMGQLRNQAKVNVRSDLLKD